MQKNSFIILLLKFNQRALNLDTRKSTNGLTFLSVRVSRIVRIGIKLENSEAKASGMMTAIATQAAGGEELDDALEGLDDGVAVLQPLDGLLVNDAVGDVVVAVHAQLVEDGDDGFGQLEVLHLPGRHVDVQAHTGPVHSAA